MGDREVDDLAAALRLLAERPDARASMGAAARRLAAGPHELERVAELQAAAFEQAAGGAAVVRRRPAGRERCRGRRRDRAGHARGLGDRQAPLRGRPRCLSLRGARRAHPGLGLARGDRHRVGARPRAGSRAGCRRPYIFVDELVYWELARSLAEDGSYSVRGRADERLQPPLPGAARAGPLGHGRAADRVRPREGAQRPRHVPRGGSRLAPRSARRRPIALAPRRRPRGRAAVARVHGHARHREPLLPVRARRSRGRSSGCSSDRRGHGSASWRCALAAAFATRSQALGFVAAILVAPLCLALIGRERATPAPVRAALRR